MPSSKPLRRLEDIIENTEAILVYVHGMALSDFENDRKTCDAVERCLERISEAASKLGDLAAELAPGVPWKQIRAFGNRLRHEYDEIRVDRLWDIIEKDCRDCATIAGAPRGGCERSRSHENRPA